MKSKPGHVALILVLMLIMVGCSAQSGTPTGIVVTSSMSHAVNPTNTSVPTSTSTVQDTSTTSPTVTKTETPSPTPTITASITLTSTPEGVTAIALDNTNCRLGPASVYMFAASFPKGDKAQVNAKNYAGTWLYIQLEEYSFQCWVAASSSTISGDLNQLPYGPNDPPINQSVTSASGVTAARNGDMVLISWNPAPSALDLHYLISAQVCNGSYVLPVIDKTTSTSYTLQDLTGCSTTSSAMVYVVNKLGYSTPVTVPWP
ncbi:hypothetical protein ACFLXB_03260 [Chloroflexota bacterium]